MLFEDRGQRTRALEVMQALIAREPEHAGALNYVGYSWAEQNVRLEEAETLIRRALQVSPSDAAIVDSLGWVMFRRGDLTGAEATLRRAIELDAEEGELHFHLAEVLAAARRFPEAVEAYDKALSLTKDPKVSAAWRKRKAAAQAKVKAAPRSTPR
jgi:Flp pilus assembly protein TadD